MLTEITIKNAKPREKPYRLYDERGMYIEICPYGGKGFRLKYRFEGRDRYMSLGMYPETTLKAARQKRDEMRLMIADGIDPVIHKRAAKATASHRAASTFEIVAREWFLKHSPNWAAGHSKTIIRRLESDIFPWLGRKPIGEIAALELLSVVHKVENRGALETAHRELAICGQVFRYAIATGRAERDPSADLKGALLPLRHESHHAAVTDPKRLGELLRMMNGYQDSFVVNCALALAPLVFVRPGELRHALWSDIDLEDAEWRFVVSKTRLTHIVPLSRQAVEVLKELHPLTGNGQYVFPNPRSPLKPMSENGVLAALRALEYPKRRCRGIEIIHSPLWRHNGKPRITVGMMAGVAYEFLSRRFGIDISFWKSRAKNQQSLELLEAYSTLWIAAWDMLECLTVRPSFALCHLISEEILVLPFSGHNSRLPLTSTGKTSTSARKLISEIQKQNRVLAYRSNPFRKQECPYTHYTVELIVKIAKGDESFYKDKFMPLVRARMHVVAVNNSHKPQHCEDLGGRRIEYH